MRRPVDSFVKDPDSFVKDPDSFIKDPDSFIKKPDSFIKDPDSFIKDPDSFIKYPDPFAEIQIARRNPDRSPKSRFRRNPDLLAEIRIRSPKDPVPLAERSWVTIERGTFQSRIPVSERAFQSLLSKDEYSDTKKGDREG